jgi:hypothetical protein
MKKFRAIAMTAALFGAVGPAIGAGVIWLERPPPNVTDLVLLSYVFGSVPALIAGIAYGGLRARANGSPLRWPMRALLGAGAGLFGCLVFFLLVSGFDLLTVSDATVRDLDIAFLRRLIVAGGPAGIVCALLAGPGRSRRSAGL